MSATRVFDRREYDVLVIGGGLAGMRAALAASASGARTGLMLKGVLGSSGSSAIAGGGLAAVMSVSDVPEDDIDKHYADTLASGDYVNDPELVRVLVREVARSPEVGDRVEEIKGLFQALQRIIEAGRDRGEVRDDVDAQVAAWAVYGALEEILTGWVLGQLPGEEDDVERAVATVVDVAHAGLAA